MFKRFHGTVEITPPDPVGSFTEIVDSVIGHFTAQYGTGVTITIDVEARRVDGFDTKLVRVAARYARRDHHTQEPDEGGPLAGPGDRLVGEARVDVHCAGEPIAPLRRRPRRRGG
ncbi:MAG: hypothetical protein IT383_16120 [Deltaproteobacteria bacterium]|nr:hypothetical protein [Deltaproteobacteria bacterium]